MPRQPLVAMCSSLSKLQFDNLH